MDAVASMFESAGDEARRRALRRMRTVATSLLVLAAIIYLSTLRVAEHWFWGYVNAGSEAAMVGALADWFAVTAIFRHPLGIPVPHTALVKRRKDELGRSLQTFVTDNFLTEEIFRERLRHAQLSLRAAHWLESKQHRTRVLEQLLKAAHALVNRADDDDVRSIVEDTLVPRLKKEPLSPVAGAFLEGIVTDGAHRGLVDLAVGELHRWLRRHPEVVADLVGERAPWWTPRWVDKRVTTYGYDQVIGWVSDVLNNREHPARLALDDLLASLAQDLQFDEHIRGRFEQLKDRLLAHPQIGTTVVSLWQSVRNSLVDAMDDRSSSLWKRGDGWLAELGDRLENDDALRTRVEQQISDVVGFMVTTYGAELATVISATVERWDADEASERIELFVGRDLQFIRINGTIVGALAGLAIHAISTLVR